VNFILEGSHGQGSSLHAEPLSLAARRLCSAASGRPVDGFERRPFFRGYKVPLSLSSSEMTSVRAVPVPPVGDRATLFPVRVPP